MIPFLLLHQKNNPTLTLINDVKVRIYVTTSLRWKVIFDKYQDKDLSQETSTRHRDFSVLTVGSVELFDFDT